MTADSRPDPGSAEVAGGPPADPRSIRVSLVSSPEVGVAPLLVAPPSTTGGQAIAELVSLDAERFVLVRGGVGGTRRRVLLLPPVLGPGSGRGVIRREVIVDGWRIEVEVESAARVALRERATRDRVEIDRSGPTEVRAIIPGVVVSVSVTPGELVTAGQQLLVVEAMKMQNELRAPRDGTIERVAVSAGRTIEVGDILLVIA